jgi:hypothetical protein
MASAAEGARPLTMPATGSLRVAQTGLDRGYIVVGLDRGYIVVGLDRGYIVVGLDRGYIVG